MIELRSYIWSMIVRKKTKICFKVETTIWWTNDFAQASSKNVKLSNITIIALMHRSDKYNHNRLRDNVAYNISDLISSLHHVKCWQWWNYHTQRSMRAHKINLYKRWTKEKNIHITSAVDPHSYFKNFSKSNDEFSKMLKNVVVSLMMSFAEIRSIEFFTSKVSDIWKSSSLTETSFFIIIFFSFVVVTISKLTDLFFFCLNSTSSFFFSFVSSVIVSSSRSMIFSRFALTSSRSVKTSFHFVKTLSRFRFVFVKHLRKQTILRFARLIASWILCAILKMYFSTRRHCFMKAINLILRFFTLTKIERLLLIVFWRSRFTRFVKLR